MRAASSRRERTAGLAECPICGKRMSKASIAAHADRCATRREKEHDASERPAKRQATSGGRHRAVSASARGGVECLVDGLVIVAREIPKSLRVKVARAEAVALAATHRVSVAAERERASLP